MRPNLVYATGSPEANEPAALTAISECLEAGMLRPVIDTTRFPNREVATAHDAQDSGRSIGKIAIDID